MATEHSVFQAPDNPNCKIWRYMDFTKFVEMLQNQALFFSRADKLGDPFEGSYSKENVRLRPQFYREMFKKGTKKSSAKSLEKWSKITKLIPRWTYINCWYINEHESAAMWKLYSSSKEAIAIQSTYQKLFDCLPEKDFFVGKVNYIDYDKEWMPEGNTFYPFVHKRKSFEHEHELRAVHQNFQHEDDEIFLDLPNEKSGISVSVNLNQLIEKVFVAPETAEWFKNLVKGVLEKYVFDFEVKQSRLDESPVYYLDKRRTQDSIHQFKQVVLKIEK